MVCGGGLLETNKKTLEDKAAESEFNNLGSVDSFL